MHVPGRGADVDGRVVRRQRNYSIAPAYAWSRLIEVQGFGQRYIDASGTNTLGT